MTIAESCVLKVQNIDASNYLKMCVESPQSLKYA